MVKRNQLTRGQARRVMYIENKSGNIDGAGARIGWVRFSKTGRTVYYRGRVLQRLEGGGVRGNFFDVETGEEYWVSGVKQRESNAHPCHPVGIVVDADAAQEYERIKGAATPGG